MQFKKKTLKDLGDMICGNSGPFRYRSSSYITDFFTDCETEYTHDGSTRAAWVAETLEKILALPHPNAQTPPKEFLNVIRVLMDQADATDEGADRHGALAALNATLFREGYEAFYGEDKHCYLRHVATNTLAQSAPNPHRPFTAAEAERRQKLAAFLDAASEDELIEQVLLPLFRQLGYHRVTASGHKDKALEYGKDIWMKYILPTQHVIYFGLQAKKGKIDSSGVSSGGNQNVAELLNQVGMMLGHEVFDPDIGKRVLVDHAIIIAGGEITKAARNWLGNKLDASKRSQIMFMDRNDILNLFVVTNLSLPAGAQPDPDLWDADSLPF